VQICKFITRPNSSEPPPTPSRGTLPTSLKKTTQRTICYLKTEKEKRNNEQPMHKTTHLQAPTHKPTLRLAKELFFLPTHHSKLIHL